MARMLLCLAVLVFSAIDTLACSCVRIADEAEPMPSGGILFRGKVVASEIVVIGEDGSLFPDVDTAKATRYFRIAVLEISEKFKGEIPPFVVVVTGPAGGACGYPFETGKRYVVDADWTEERLPAKLAGGVRAVTTSLCALTAPEEASSALLQRLRKTYKSATPLFVR